jgi:hypothetical protein
MVVSWAIYLQELLSGTAQQSIEYLPTRFHKDSTLIENRGKPKKLQ